MVWSLLGFVIFALFIVVLGAVVAARTTTTFPLRRANPWESMPASSGLRTDPTHRWEEGVR
jgi:hypothetical protein